MLCIQTECCNRLIGPCSFAIETRVNEEIKTIEDEISAYKESTDARIEALNAAKDLHDYEQSIAEKSKSIANLERQIAYDTINIVSSFKHINQAILQYIGHCI